MIRTAICSAGAPDDVLRRLSDHADTVIKLMPHSSLSLPVASHADMIFTSLDGKIFFDKIYIEANRGVVEELVSATKLELVETDDALSDKYPGDVAFNVLISDGVAAGRAASISPCVMREVSASGRRFVDVKQGYAACSSLLAGRALVTADEGMAKALAPFVKVLCVRPGHIALPPYDTGFIGGASGFDGSCVYFAGDVFSHPDAEEIVPFIEECGYGVVSLSGDALYDVGGIKFIMSD